MTLDSAWGTLLDLRVGVGVRNSDQSVEREGFGWRAEGGAGYVHVDENRIPEGGRIVAVLVVGEERDERDKGACENDSSAADLAQSVSRPEDDEGGHHRHGNDRLMCAATIFGVCVRVHGLGIQFCVLVSAVTERVRT